MSTLTTPGEQRKMRHAKVVGLFLSAAIVVTSMNSVATAVEPSDKIELSAVTWNLSKAKGDSDLSAAQAVVAALLIESSEVNYPKFKSKTSPKAKKIVSAWLNAKKAKKSDAIASKMSGFTTSNGKTGDIYILKVGVAAWQSTKNSKKSDADAANAFTRTVWEASLGYSAVLMTNEDTILEIKTEVENWNASKG